MEQAIELKSHLVGISYGKRGMMPSKNNPFNQSQKVAKLSSHLLGLDKNYDIL